MNVLKRAVRRWTELGTRVVVHEAGTRERRPVVLRSSRVSPVNDPFGAGVLRGPGPSLCPVPIGPAPRPSKRNAETSPIA